MSKNLTALDKNEHKDQIEHFLIIRVLNLTQKNQRTKSN